jgi:2'-5' RNA ligase
VTLLGGITLARRRAIERTQELARVLPPLSARLEGAGQSEALFRCLYLQASGAGLRLARSRALRLFRSDPASKRVHAKRSRFLPHLSLVYGRLPVALRRKLALEIEDSIVLTFIVRQIALVRTSGDHRSWRTVAICRLEDRPNVTRRQARARGGF